MRRLCLISLFGLAALVGCQTERRTEERSPAEALFRSRCQTCHRLPAPDKKTPPEWTEWMARHREKAKLSDTELAQILAYLSGPTDN